jgi:hypothetical protein
MRRSRGARAPYRLRKRRGVRWLARHLGVAAISTVVLAAAVLYAVSPAIETIAAQVVSVQTVRAGSESIEGRALEDGRPARGTFVSVYRLVHGREIFVGAEGVNSQGRFTFRVAPGRYVVVVRYESKKATVAFTLGRGKTIFIAVTVKHHGGFVGAPVLFNY